MREWFAASELAGQPGMPNTERRVRSSAQRQGWPSRKRTGRGGGREYSLTALPPATQAALVASELPPKNPATSDTPSTFRYDPEELWSWASRRPGTLRKRGQARALLLGQVMRLVASGHSHCESYALVAAANGESAITLKRWYYSVRNHQKSDWPAALIPGHCGRTAVAHCSPQAWDYFKADLLRPEKPAFTAVYERLQRVANERGWSVPSLRTLRRRIVSEIPRAAWVAAREGNDALKHLYPAQERDRGVFGALEAVNADGHKFDVFVKWPDGEIVRPILVGWQDLYSGKILGWRVDKTENSDQIRLSFGDVVERYGIPEHAYLDNGRGFASKWLTGGTPTRYRFKITPEDPVGLLTLLDVQVHWTTPYWGQSKPIERAWRDFCEYISKHPAFSGAYTGNNPTAKPENYGSRAIPLQEFLAILETEIAAHNARPGRRTAVCNGRSFNQAFEESYAQRPIRKATREQRRLWLLAAEGVKVKRDGTLTLNTERRNRYAAPELLDHVGERIAVRFDPQDLHTYVYCYTLDGRFIAQAECLEAVGFNDTGAAREHNRERKRFLRATKDLLKASQRMSVMDAARMLPGAQPEPELDARIVKPLRPARELAALPPEPTPLTDEQHAIQQSLIAEQRAAEVVDITDDPRRNYARWARLEQRIAAGERVTDALKAQLAIYQATSEHKSMRELFEEFGMAIESMAEE